VRVALILSELLDGFLVSDNQQILRLNVGFITSQNVGYSRKFTFDHPYIHIPPDLDLYELSGHAIGTKTAKGILIQVSLDAVTTLECSRCLEDYPHSIGIEFTELFVFDHQNIDESAQRLPEHGGIDLAPLVREEMLVSVPINPLCSSQCLGLCPICGGNRNEVLCDHPESSVDPRLEVLRSYLVEEPDSPAE